MCAKNCNLRHTISHHTTQTIHGPHDTSDIIHPLSHCTQYFNDYFDPDYVKCMDNAPSVRWGDAVCGNGFIEEGEECDCGSSTTCVGTF